MIALFLSVALAQQPLPPPAPVAQAQAQPNVEPVEPWLGTLSAARAQLQRLSNDGEHDSAIALGSRMLAMPSWSEIAEERRAAALFDLGVALGSARAVEPAAEAFHKARGLAGSAQLGLDAIYDAGTYRLQGAEELRLAIPELREKLGLPPLPQAAAPNAGVPIPGVPMPGAQPAPEEQPDPIAIARQAYLAARSDLVDRWRCDTRDRDTRANLELVQRRLRELDELEKQRDEQQQQQQDQQQDQKQNEQQKDQQDPKQDPQKSDQEQQDPQDPKDDEQQQDQQQPKPEDQEKQDQKQAQPDPKDMQDVKLSPEEVMRLLDQLQKIEEQAEQVRAQLRERRRVPVKKDW